MGLTTEKEFPRGGKKKLTNLKQKRQKKISLFETKTKKKKSTKSLNKLNSNESNKSTLSKKSKFVCQPLTYNTLSEDMLVLGTIYQVYNYHLNVQLPNGVVGRIPITHVSKNYNAALENVLENNMQQNVQPLPQMFKVGQSIVVKVTEKSLLANNRHKIVLSMAPDQVQTDWSKKNLQVGFCGNAAVVSIEEHGYQMDIGVKGVRCFLKKQDAARFETVWNDKRPLAVGQVLRSLITKFDDNLVQLTVDPKKVESHHTDGESISLITILPGMAFSSSIKKPVQGGFKLRLTDGLKAYVCTEHVAREISEGQEVIPRVLYVIPLVKTIYVSLLPKICLRNPPSAPIHSLLDTIHHTKVKEISSFGISFELTSNETQIKGLVPLKRSGVTFSDSEDKSILDLYREKFPVGNKLKVKLLSYNYMENIFVATMEKDVIAEKWTNITSLKIGDIVPCVIESHSPQGCQVTIGTGPKRNLWAFCPKLFLSDIPLAFPETKFPPGKPLNGKVLNVDGFNIIVTLRQSLIKLDEEIISSYDQVKIDGVCRNVLIIRVEQKGLLVRFGGDVTGWAPTKYLSVPPPENVEESFQVGQLIKCYIKQFDPETKRIVVSLINKSNKLRNYQPEDKNELKKGYSYTLIVKQITPECLIVRVKDGENGGIIPVQHLTDFTDLAPFLLNTYSIGDTLNANCYSLEGTWAVFTMKRSIMQFFKSNKKNKYEINDLIPVVVEKMKPLGIDFSTPLLKISKVFLPFKFVNKEEVEHLIPGQTVLARILDKYKKFIEINVGVKIFTKQPYNYSTRIKLLTYYLADKARVEHWLISVGGTDAPQIGERVSGVCLEVKDIGAIIQLEKGGLLGLVAPDHMKGIELEQGQRVTGTVITLGVGPGMIELTLLPKLISHLTSNQEIDISHVTTPRNLMADVVCLHGEYVSVSLRGRFQGKLVYIPLRRNLNESMATALAYGATKYNPGDLVKISLLRAKRGEIIALFHEDFKLFRRFHRRLLHYMIFNEYEFVNKSDNLESATSVQYYESDSDDAPLKVVVRPSKKKLPNDNDDHLENESQDEQVEEKEEDNVVILETKNKKRRKNIGEKGEDVESKKAKLDETLEIKSEPEDEDGEEEDALRPDPFDWEATTASLMAPIKNESAENTDVEESEMNKRPLTAAMIEARTRAAEEKLLDPKSAPETADDFERLVVASPDSSLCWIKYMAFYIQSTELDAARGIAQRALATISFREEQEKLNVWLAFLNLENLYGTKETLEKILHQALQLNNPYKIHMPMLDMFWSSGKIEEADKLTRELCKRYRDNKDMWPQLAEHYFKAGETDKARNVFDRALQVLDKKQHVDTIVCWAHAENRRGNYEKGQSLLEHVVSTYPKRVDVWSSYVDMLIKHESIHLARNALERAVNQSLPARKIKTLYTKWLSFEEKYGTPENVDNVREKAKKYVESNAISVVDDE